MGLVELAGGGGVDSALTVGVECGNGVMRVGLVELAGGGGVDSA